MNELFLHNCFSVKSKNKIKNKILLLIVNMLFVQIFLFAQKHSIGEKFGGGIIFYVDSTGQHDLISTTADQSKGIQWYNGVVSGLIYYDPLEKEVAGSGAKITTLIVGELIKDNPKGNFEAKVCTDYSVTVDGIIYKDWYLPSKFELNLLHLQQSIVGGFTSDAMYWSSSEKDGEHANSQDIMGGYQRSWNKSISNYVRAIRAF